MTRLLRPSNAAYAVRRGGRLGAVTTPEALVQETERRLEAAQRRLARLEAELAVLEQGVTTLEADLTAPIDVAASDPGGWPSFTLGLAPPLGVLAAAAFFDAGVWPLGLLGGAAAVAMGLALPLFSGARR